MKKLLKGGPFVLPPVSCTARRREYFQRNNRIIATCATLTAFAGDGQRLGDAAVAEGRLEPGTPSRIKIGGFSLQTSYRVIRSAFSKAGAQLANQVFLQMYGSFEAFLADLVHDAFVERDKEEPIDATIRLLAQMKWRGKLDRISSEFDLKLGHRKRMDAYDDLDLGFFGKATRDPMEFLQTAADVRHRLVHSAGRVDAKLAEKYPGAGVTVGELIELPFEAAFVMHLFFVPLTELLDAAFSARFSWARVTCRTEQLWDPELRIW